MNIACEKKLEFFQQYGTKPEEWTLCELIECDFDEWGNVLNPRFIVEHHYQFVPESDNTKSVNWENPDSYYKHCKLCGQELVHCFMIKHERKQLVTIIGRDCAKKYPYLNLEVQLKEMLEKKYQPAFMSWELTTVKRILSSSRFQQVDYNGNLKTNGGRLNLKEKPLKLHSMLSRLKNKKIGYKKMRKVLHMADRLWIPIPYVLLPLIKKKSVHTLGGLDKYFA